MKIQLLLLSIILFTTRSSHAQHVEARIIFIDSLIKKENSHESGLRLTIANIGDKRIYIPNLLSQFNEQVTDSMIIYKLQGGEYKAVSKQSGAPANLRQAPFYGSTSYLLDKYFLMFEHKKKFGDSLASANTELVSKANINPLFLSKGECFILYQISPFDYLFQSAGDYKIDFRLGERKGTGFPDQISSYQKVTFSRILAPSLYISVREVKKGSKVTLRNENKQLVKSFLWRFKRT